MPSQPVVLCVDDDADQLELLESGVAPISLFVLRASSAEEAHELLRAIYVDVIVCDLRMPRESALDLLRQLIAIGPHAPVVVVSAGWNEAARASAVALGAAGVLARPHEDLELRDAVRAAVAADRRHPMPALAQSAQVVPARVRV